MKNKVKSCSSNLVFITKVHKNKEEAQASFNIKESIETAKQAIQCIEENDPVAYKAILK